MPHKLKSQAYSEAATTNAFRLLTGTTTITALALLLGAGPVMMGVVAAIPYVTRLGQSSSDPLSSRFGSKRTSLTALGLERLFLLLCIPATLSPAHPLLLVLGAFTLSQAAGSVYDGCVTVLYAGSVPIDEQDIFYAARQRWVSLASLVFGVAGGLPNPPEKSLLTF